MSGKIHKKRQDLLKTLLSPLLKEWGYEEVRRCLSELAHQANADYHREDGRQLGERSKGKNAPYHKPTATDLTTRIEAPEARKSLLLRLAAQFDQKGFLPTVSDVRHFLEMRGQDAGGIKLRQDAFKRILNLVAGMADEELEKFVKGNLHSGPSQLGPLSDAIRTTSAVVRSAETPADADRIDTVSTGDTGTAAESSSVPQEDKRESTHKS